MSRSAGRYRVSEAAYLSISGESGRADQSARWKRLSSRTPMYFSSSAASPTPGSLSKLRCDPRIEDAGGAEAVLAIEEAEVVVRVVEDDLHFGIGQHQGKRLQALYRQRVHHRRLVARADLQQIDAIDKPVEARGLGVDREQGRAPEAREQRLQVRLRLDERNAVGAHSDFETRSSPAEISSSAFASTL